MHSVPRWIGGAVAWIILALAGSADAQREDGPHPPSAASPSSPSAVSGASTADRSVPGVIVCREGTQSLSAIQLFARTLDLPPATVGPRANRFDARVDPLAAPSGTSVVVTITPPNAAMQLEWQKLRLAAAARPEDAPSGDVARHRPVWAELRAAEAQAASISLDRPSGITYAFAERWTAVIAVCNANDELVGFAPVQIEVRSRLWSVVGTVLVMLALYAIVAACAARVHRRRLDAHWQALAPAEPPDTGRARAWRIARCLDPIFISQDAMGVGSLARLQILVFTFAVVGVYCYILMRTGLLSALSETVLALLGITAAGSSLSRVFGTSGTISTSNRMWLAGRGAIRPVGTLPSLNDVVAADGEVELSRVQAIAFSVFTVFALVINGPRDLAGFQIPQQMLYLLGLSQIVYVAGKAIPAEAVKRLNQELDALRGAERAASEARQRTVAAEARGDTVETAVTREAERTACATFEAAKAAAAVSLEDILGERFDRQALMAAKPF